MRAAREFEALLGRLEQAVADTRSMARTIEHGGVDVHVPTHDARSRC